MSADLIQSALKDILAEKQDHVAGSIAHQRMERAETALRTLLPTVDAGKPMSAALQALIESGQVEDGDADLVEPQGQALPELPKPDIRVDAFGDILPTNGRKFVMGNFFTTEQMHAYARAYASQLALPAGSVPVQGKFFLLDPAGYSHPEIFNTEEERDAAAKDAIADHLDGDNGWSEEVENIVCGVITHEAGKVDIRRRPSEDDPEYEDWPDHDFDEICNYAMLPVASPALAQPVDRQFPTKPHLRGAITVLFDQEQKKFHDAQANLAGMGDSWASWEQHFNDALADFFWPMVGSVAQPVADEREGGAQ